MIYKDMQLVRHWRKGVLTGYQFYNFNGEEIPDPSLAIAALEVVKNHLRLTEIKPMVDHLEMHQFERGVLAREKDEAERYLNTHYTGHPQDPVGYAIWHDWDEMMTGMDTMRGYARNHRLLINRENSLLVSIGFIQLGMKKLLRMLNF